MAESIEESYYVRHEQKFEYDPCSSLNTYDVYLPRIDNTSESSENYWIIYIHGGAWRDPMGTSNAILPTLSHLPPRECGIAGIGTINYRLSPYPSHQTDPSLPDDEARNVRHPTHIEDVLTAITHCQRRFGFNEKYILAGHSCGATLALQAVMGRWKSRTDTPHVLPVAIVGVEGIYDLKLLVDTHTHPIYREFLEGAFGSEEQWKEPSPVVGKYSTTWENGRVVVLAHSSEDKLVDWVQTERMSDQLWKEKRSGRRDMIMKIQGNHDEIWEDGREMAKAIKAALEMLRRSK